MALTVPSYRATYSVEGVWTKAQVYLVGSEYSAANYTHIKDYDPVLNSALAFSTANLWSWLVT